VVVEGPRRIDEWVIFTEHTSTVIDELSGARRGRVEFVAVP